MLRGPSVEAMTFDMYKQEVCRLAHKMTHHEAICTDTIKASWERKVPVGMAAVAVRNDTEVWAGDWTFGASGVSV